MRQQIRRWVSAMVLIGLAAGCHRDQSPRPVTTFPKGFLWGAATAAHQVEGGNVRNDWWSFEQLKGTIARGDHSGDAVDHYRQFDADFAQAEAMRHNAHRLSIEWARIEPAPGQYDEAALRHYDAVLASMARHHLQPMVTLWHFTNPQWVQERGGWENPATTAAWLRFVDLVVTRYRDRVHDWITVNEPNVYGFQAYDKGVWPPRLHDRERAVGIIITLLKAHGQASRRIHTIDPRARVGIANHLAVFDPLQWWNPLDRLKAYGVDRLFNGMALEAQTSGHISVNLPGLTKRDEDYPALAHSVDFIGVNYYTRWRESLLDKRDQLVTAGAPRNDLGWEYYPEGMYRTLMAVKRYRLPVVITENGTADRDDTQRRTSLVETLRAIQEAMADGVDVRGYFHWSLMDNFEWAEGYTARFGLMSVDRSKPGMPRSWRPSARLYQSIIRTGVVPASDAAVNVH